tara:strand:+ start:255 stop:914 length:660 start_codon:yes stop_codon:yes gene_type:complete
MNRNFLFFFILFPIFCLLSCSKSNNNKLEVDNKSYISKFELVQLNSNNDMVIKITSPKAIIDPSNNDIEVFDSSIEIKNKIGQTVKINSGNSTFNNNEKLLKVYNNVNISLLDNKQSIITTDSFDWDFKKANINFFSPLYINFKNSTLIASNGSYNIDSSFLKLNNNVFNSSINNPEGHEVYRIEIISDITKWLKANNTLEFSSSNKQVETTIKFLSNK